MSSQEEEEEGEDKEESPEINLFLQEAVYALMAEFGIQINPNPNPPLESQQEPSRSTIRSIRIIGPALPFKKRSLESTGGDDDSEENEKKKNKKEDEKPRRESAQDSEENERRKQEEVHEARSKPVEVSPGCEEKMEESVHEPRKPSCEQAQDSLENVRKKQEDDQGPRIEPAVQDSKTNEIGEVQSSRNEEEYQFAALMLLIFVARYIDFWRRLTHYDEADNYLVSPLNESDYSPSLRLHDEANNYLVSPLNESDYSPSLRLHDFQYTPAVPVRRRLFDLNDEADHYQEPTIAEGLAGHLISVFYDTRAQISFLRILSEYMNVNNEDPSANRSIPAEFITDWFPQSHAVLVSDVYNAFEFLERQHKEKLRQIKEKSNYWDQYEQMAYEYGSKIWGRGDHVDFNFPETTERSSMRTRLMGVEIRAANDSQIAQNATEKSPVKDLNDANWTHLDTELVIFDRVIGYKLRNGRNPFPDNSDSADFIKNWLQIDVPVKEFNELITHMRKKYEKRAGKRLLNESPSEAKDVKVLDFALKIWE